VDFIMIRILVTVLLVFSIRPAYSFFPLTVKEANGDILQSFTKGLIFNGFTLSTSGGEVTVLNPGGGGGGNGSVTSIDISGSNGIVATGGPITDNGTINVTLNQGSVLVPSAIGTTVQAYSSNLDTLATNNGSGLTGLVLASTDLTDTTNVARLNAAQTFTNNNTFSTTSSSTTVAITHASGSGIALDISKGGNNEGLRVTKTGGSGNAVTIAGGDLGTNSNINLSGETASTIAHFDSSKNIKSLATSTYPSLTELSYVKGVTSAIQTQLNAKGVGDALTTNPLSQFAATTSSQLAGVISDETGSGALVFGTSPTINGATLLNTITVNGTLLAKGHALHSNAINTQSGTTYTVDNDDNGKIVTFSNGSAITVTIPDTVPANFGCTLIQIGNGQVSVSAGGSLNLRTSLGSSFNKLHSRWSSGAVFRVGSSNDLIFSGDIDE
jgi:hypothetical protein